MSISFFSKAIIASLILTINMNYARAVIPIKKGNSPSYTAIRNYTPNRSLANMPPEIIAEGNQIYCPGTAMKIVTDVTITDPDDSSTDAIYIQISSGYENEQDILALTGTNPNIISSWDASTGKLKLSSPTPGIQVTYVDFIAAIKDVTFSNSSPNPAGVRNFSISIGQANYLPRNGHYYQYVPSIGTSWTTARDLASNSNYYGLQGYLATLTAEDEAKISGEQAEGAGWIGGSDAETEGTWKWVTGPEAGTPFWIGIADGTTTAPFNYANWNNGEPNQFGGAQEDYAHITAAGVGILGSWNDLTNTGDATGAYQPKGYIVEYGGMPGEELPIQISASTKITIPKIETTTPATRCGTGSVTLQATASDGTVSWYANSSGGDSLFTGNNYTTPVLTATTTYYVDAGCPSRIPVTATINTIPTVTMSNRPVSRCGPGSVTLEASTDSGIINWYLTSIGGAIAGTGTNFTTPIITANTTYFAEADNEECTSSDRKSVEVKIYTPPIVMDQEVTKCKSTNIILDAVLLNMSYSWSTGETTQKISVANPGTFTVDITSPSPENCTSRKTITVRENDAPKIVDVAVNETTVIISLQKEETYFEFSIDGINYQNSNVFYNAPSGLQTAYVREVNECSLDTKTFIVLVTPRFFTPNNDTYNDYWEVKGLANYPKAEVSIFDRYGKLIIILNSTNTKWDGTFNDSEMPSSDYWYVLKIDANGAEKSGHFSLKR
jgi:gliding motility-associated-like protein